MTVSSPDSGNTHTPTEPVSYLRGWNDAKAGRQYGEGRCAAGFVTRAADFVWPEQHPQRHDSGTDKPIRSMDEFRRRYLPSTQEPHAWQRSDRCAHCGRPFDDPIHEANR